MSDSMQQTPEELERQIQELVSKLKRIRAEQRARPERKSDRLITYEGVTLKLSEWSERLGIPYWRLHDRLHHMPVERAFTQAIRPRINLRLQAIKFKGEIRSLSEWAKVLGLPYSVLYARLKNKWSVERAFTSSLRRPDYASHS